MKTTQQIIGMPVISISDGNEIGMVKNVIINAAKGTVDFFVIDSGVRSLAGGVIPAGRVLGIGEYALTIQESDDISDIVKIPAAIELFQKNITVSGTRVLTKKGTLLGETGDIYINENDQSYPIVGVEFIPNKPDLKSGIIPRSSIITFGKNLLVVNDDVTDTLLDIPGDIDSLAEQQKKNQDITVLRPEPELKPEPESEADAFGGIDFFADEPARVEFAEPEKPESVFNIPEIPAEEPQDALFGFDGDRDGFHISQPEPELPDIPEPEPEPDESQMTAAQLFEYRQKQYLLGKKVTKTIYSQSGDIIAQVGDIITESVIDAAKREGKLIELVMNYE
ncbi:MAG TPA: PRC-barrel domain-containing protein [Thermoclostridium caenicola]|nr:PRC-barrel domain-containing protein [Thermoclostridium caenicola]